MTLLDVRDLAVRYDTPHGVSQALDGASLTVAAGELVAVVGESGSGKSTLGMAVLGLLPASAQRLTGDLMVDGASVFGLDPARLRRLRRTRLGLVLQDAAGSLDPTRRIGRQLAEHLDRPDRAAVLSRLEQVRLPDVDRVARSYPHQLSGGMAQRVAIAIALARSPGLLVADEPTAALDTEIKHDVLRLLADSCRERGTALLVLTHDLTGIAAYCTRLVVMYGGRVVETGPPDEVLERPRHPYTRGLLHAVPGHEIVGGTLRPIAGSPPVLTGPSAGCAFAPRCEFRVVRCGAQRPEPSGDAARVLCHRDGELDAVVMPHEAPEVSR